MVTVRRSVDDQAAAQEAAEAVADLFRVYRSVPVLFLVSGGSSLALFKYLSDEPFDGRVTLGVSDERHSSDPSVNNFSQIIRTPWYARVAVKGLQTIDTRPAAGESVEDAGHRFDASLKAWKAANPTGKVMITLGIGMDGHTAGMMPFSAKASGGKPTDEQEFLELFDNPDVWAVGYDAGDRTIYPLRVTTTMPLLRMADDAVVYVCGLEKVKPLAALLDPSGSHAKTPARVIHEMKHCLLYTDQPVGRVDVLLSFPT